MENSKSSSNFYMLTAQILNDKNLNHAEKLTMAILNGLADETGKCWPSNEWLSEKLDIHTRKVQEILEKLVKNNYIKREIVSCANNPFKKYRVIYVCSNFKFCLRDAENGTLDIAENGMTVMPKTACIIDKTSSLIDKKEEGTASPPSAPPHSPNNSRSPRKKVIEEKIQRAPEVYLTETQHVTMLKKCEGNEKLREMAYNELSDWKIGKGITGGSNDFKSASSWALEKARQTAMNNPLEKNMELVAKLKKKHSSNPNINFGHNYIEFVRGALNVTCIKFTDASFIDQVFTQLKKMNINPGDL